MIKEEQLLEQRELREQLAGRVEVLEKVKELLLIPSTNEATLQQVADYYEVGLKAIETISLRHKDELLEDGLSNKSYKDFLNIHYEGLETVKGKATFTYKNGEVLNVPMRGLKVFPRRAILRVGMLLRDSKIAKEVRTQLLNIEEKASEETKVQDLNEEQKLMLEVGMSVASGNASAVAIASANLIAFKNRHIEKLQQDNKALAGEILTWSDRSKLNFAVRKYSKMVHTKEPYAWYELYKELRYKHHIDVKLRGDKPYIKHIKENEWSKVVQSFSAMCESKNISPSDILSDL